MAQKSGIEIISPVEFNELAHSAQPENIDLIERTLELDFPVRITGSAGELSWTVDTTAALAYRSDHDDFIQTEFRLQFQSQSALQHFPETKQESLFSSLSIAAGRIPLSLIPLLVDQEATAGGPYLSENHIEVLPSPSISLETGAVFSGGGLIPEDISGPILEVFGLDLFSPQDLSRSQLRRALGLEVIDEAVPDGVYLIENDMGLGGVYVEGNLDGLGLAVDGDFQVLNFRIGQEEWRLTFSPVHGTTTFSSPHDSRCFELTPPGLVIVNGGIISLEAGTIDMDGEFQRSEKEIPCILRGVSLNIIASERITLTTHLIRQGVSWQDEIPVIKNADSQLHIFSTGRDILGNPTGEGNITIETDGASSLKIEASLTAAETGIQSEDGDKEILLFGSLHSGGHRSHGHTLKLIYDPNPVESTPPLAPHAAQPVLFVNEYRIMEWREDR